MTPPRGPASPAPAAKLLPPRVAKLAKKIDEIKAYNALLRATDERRRLEFVNGMGQLVQNAGYRQDDITSMQPLITANQYAVITLNYVNLIYMYSTHGLIQTAIDQPVLDAFREPFALECDTLSPRNLTELEDWWAEKVSEPFTEYRIWTRLFGGGALVMNTAGDPSKPLSEKELQRGRFSLYAAARWELGGTWRYSPAYNFYGVTFDQSRVITGVGKKMPWILERQLSGWGASLIARMAEDFNVYLRTRNALYETINEFKIDVYKMKGYNEQLITAQGTQQVDQRIAFTNALKNFHQALIIDAEDDYIVKHASFAGIADIMRENRMGLVAATRIPARKLFSDSGGGKLAEGNGEDAMENYNAMVVSEERKPSRPDIRRLLAIGANALYGGKHKVRFEEPALRTMDAKTEEEVKTSKQARILGDLEAGLIDEHEAAVWALREGLLPFATKLAKGGLKKVGFPQDVKTKGKGDGEDGERSEGPSGRDGAGSGRRTPGGR